jgi:hypothetical protein
MKQSLANRGPPTIGDSLQDVGNVKKFMFPKQVCSKSDSQPMVCCGMDTAKDHKDLKAHKL